MQASSSTKKNSLPFRLKRELLSPAPKKCWQEVNPPHRRKSLNLTLQKERLPQYKGAPEDKQLKSRTASDQPCVILMLRRPK